MVEIFMNIGSRGKAQRLSIKNKLEQDKTIDLNDMPYL